MKFQIIEILGLFLLVVGAGTVVAAAAMVAVALGVLVAGAFLLLGGGLTVYVAASLERATSEVKP